MPRERTKQILSWKSNRELKGLWLLIPLVSGAVFGGTRGRSIDCYLSLDAIEASEPEDLASAKLPFSVVNLIHVLKLLQLLVWDLLLLGAVARRFQEF